jgi:hypothetical protein
VKWWCSQHELPEAFTTHRVIIKREMNGEREKNLTVKMELVKCLGVQLLLAQVVVVVAATSMY